MVADHATRPRAETLPRIRTLTVFRILSDKTIIRRSDGASSSSNQIPAQLQIYPSCSGSGEKAPEFRYLSPIKRRRIKPNLNGAPLTVRLFDDGHVHGVVWEQDFADVAAGRGRRIDQWSVISRRRRLLSPGNRGGEGILRSLATEARTRRRRRGRVDRRYQ